MDRFRQKSKKEKPMKHVDKEKSPLFITDVKTIKENVKIKEILRSVKMNSSMRIKAPRGSVVMSNNDFCDVQEDSVDGNNEASAPNDLQEAKNSDLVDKITHDNEHSAIHPKDDIVGSTEQTDSELRNLRVPDLIVEAAPACTTPAQHSAMEPTEHHDISQNNETANEMESNLKTNSQCVPNVKSRERKLSLDHTMLAHREGLSKSEMDLHSIGKSPLERKSSFFRKKMDSFLKNTTEIFKRQSLGSKSQPVIRRGSMSVSLQSLNEKVSMDDEYGKSTLNSYKEMRGSGASINSGSTLGASEAGSAAGSQGALSTSQPIPLDGHSSPKSVNGVYTQDSLLNSRAISMSSGLDTAFGQRRRKTSRSNRVTWVGSEGLTNYLRRLTQDETEREMLASHSYQDMSSIPESAPHAPHAPHAPRVDSKGRRLSYQRAVSGEEPAPPRHDSTLRRRNYIPEHSQAYYELANHLAEFTRNGVPKLTGYNATNICDPALSYISWAETASNIEHVYDWKKLTPNEEARQAVIRELVGTEANYIKHLMAIVEVFMAAAHALQDSGTMLDVDTARLFLNIPDVVDASLAFWEAAIYPMLADAINNKNPFNTNFMSPGFCRFRDIFHPYEKYVSEQSKAVEYYRSLSNNTEFTMYLTWCHAQKSCNRLQLSDMMVKPMQRLTKYALILRRIIAHTDTEPERTSLIAMETFAKNYVVDLNRSIRQRDELETFDAVVNSIDVYEMDFKDDDMDRYFKMYSQLNLKAPMINCIPCHSRTLIYEGDLRFKDHLKEVEARVILLTDMMLICKKLSKGSVYPYKLIRPKYMVDRMLHFPRVSNRNNKESAALVVVMLDEVGSASYCFALSDPTKDPNPQATVKLWDQKIKEAKTTYEIGVWYARNPSRDLSEVEMDSSAEYALSAASGGKAVKQISEELNIEREARERVAAMLHRAVGASTEHDCSQASINTDSFDGEASGAWASGGRVPGLHNPRHPMHRHSTSGSSRNSRLSSFQQSTSAASHEEPQAGPSDGHVYRAGSSVEHHIPPLNPDDAVTSITVNVVSESESETVVPSPQPSVSPLKLASRSPLGSSHNTLRVQPQSGVLALVHSLPDLTLDPSPTRHPPQPSPQTASEKLYQSHQELLQRNRLAASHHHQYLSPDHRGTSYPPPSPTRASLRRGLAFSDSFKYPPLSKMGHVNSQSQAQAEPVAGPSTVTAAPSSSAPAPAPAPAKSEKGAVNPMLVPSGSTEKEKKSKHLISSRHKGGSGNGSGSGSDSSPRARARARADDKAE